MKSKLFFFLSIIMVVFFTTIILSQDFQVSTHSAVGFLPHIAADSSGNFVVVWDDCRNIKIPYGGTGSDGDIYGQQYNKKGVPVGGNFRISDDSIDTDISFAGQTLPRISMNKRGEFVVTWVDTRPKGTPADPTLPLEFNIYAQMFDLNGNPVGANLLVNDTATSGQLNPDVIVRDDGSFVIIWINTLDGRGGANRVFRICLQSFDSSGARVGLNQTLSLYAQQPRIALFTNGNFVIAADTSAQIFSFPSKEIGQPFNISSGFTREIKISGNDIIYITQVENRIIMNSFLDLDIFLQAYDKLGNSVINKFKVNDDNTYFWQVNPTLSINNEHVFVAWEDYRNGYQIGESNCKDIYGQRFDLNLSQIGTNFKVSHETDESGQFIPTATLRNDTIYIAWFDGRKMEFYPNVYPPISKVDVWATVQDFHNPVEGTPIHCKPPPPPIPSSFNFFQSFPNPTHALSIFMYDLPEDANVKLSFYNVLGKEVKVLITEFQGAGYYYQSFLNNDLPSGIYFAKLVAETSTGKYF
jgi:hypothetical protein